MEYTREKLIEICERAIVHIDAWGDRDTDESQKCVGVCWAYLKSGCEFEVLIKSEHGIDFCVTDDRTIWLKFYIKDFNWFEMCNEGDLLNESELYYLPTEQRLNRFRNEDWY